MQDQANNAYPGLIIAYFGQSVAVQTADGEIIKCQLRRNQDLPVVGDYVAYQQNTDGSATIESIAPRRSLLYRGDARGKNKPIAANLDRLVIVMAPPPVFSEYLIDRYIVAAELCQITPLIVVNKIDILKKGEMEALDVRLSSYKTIGYDTLMVTTRHTHGLSALESALVGRCAVLVGPSGVGKSSIIAALSQDDDILIGEVSGSGAGRHTTTATRLYHLADGGSLIDSPGVREFNLWTVTQGDIIKAFRDIMAQASGCRFRDCRHLNEPGCKVQQAVSDGKLSAKRYENYQALMQEASE